MGVTMNASGLLLDASFKPDEGDGQGFINATILPEGSRETLGVWAFGDSAAGREVVRRFAEHGIGQEVAVVVDMRAKTARNGGANLSSQLVGVTNADGEFVTGRVQPVAAGNGAPEPF